MDTTEHLIRSRLADLSNEQIAAALGRDQSVASRIRSGEAGIPIGKLGAFMATLGLAVVEANGDMVTVPASRYREAARALIDELRRSVE